MPRTTTKGRDGTKRTAKTPTTRTRSRRTTTAGSTASTDDAGGKTATATTSKKKTTRKKTTSAAKSATKRTKSASETEPKATTRPRTRSRRTGTADAETSPETPMTTDAAVETDEVVDAAAAAEAALENADDAVEQVIAALEEAEAEEDAAAEAEAEAAVSDHAAKTPPTTPPNGRTRRGRPVDEAEVKRMAGVWDDFKAEPTELKRNYLIEYYYDLVRSTAERMHARLPGEVDVDDLAQAGLFGLLDAIDAFDPERGVKFETYCSQRIRGAIFDELRAMDWVPRLVRARTAKVERARKSLEMELGRKPTEDELCARLQVDKAEFEKLSKDSRPVGVVSLNRKYFETDSSKDVREIDVIKDQRQSNPLTEIQRQDLKLLITKGLSRAERLIVVLYYYEEMTMKEIGTTLDLSESRVSQMHSSILQRLKAQMQHREKEF